MKRIEMKESDSLSEKRKAVTAFKEEFKKIKNNLKEVRKQHRRCVITQAECNLYPEEHSYPDRRVIPTAATISIMEQQFNQVNRELEKLEQYLESDDEESDDIFDIGNLPQELLMEIFKYLNLNELCQIARVCKTWHKMTRSQVFWKSIQANINECRFTLSVPKATFHLINMLPSCITRINLNFDSNYGSWKILYTDFMKKLREKCPNLQILVLNRIIFTVKTDELVKLCAELPKNVRILALPHCSMYLRGFRHKSDDVVSNIEVLDLSECVWTITGRLNLTNMPNLKKLRLAGCEFFHDEFFEPLGPFIDQIHVLDLERTMTRNITFSTIISYSQHLTELYVCWTLVKDGDLLLIEEHKGFPCLKIICLRGCDISDVGIFSLIKSCPAIQKIFVGRSDLKSENICTLSNSEIVEDLDFGCCNHYQQVNYMLE